MSNTLDFCQTGYDYERYQLNELENENMKLKKQLSIATKALKKYARWDSDAGNGCLYEMPAPSLAQQALKEMEVDDER